MDTDDGWIDAMRPYWGGGIVPLYKKEDGTIDPVKTMDHFCKMHDVKKIGPNGEYL